MTVCVVFVSAIVHSAAGIGFAMLATAVTSLYLPGASTAGIINCCILLMLLIVFFRFYRYIDWKMLLPPTVGMIVGKVLGILLLSSIGNDILKKILGLVLVLFAIYFFFMGDKVKIRPTNAKGLALGLVAGFIGGLYNISGPFLAIYYFPLLKDKNVYYATVNTAFIPAAIFGTITHIAVGNLTAESLPLIGACLGSVVLGMVVGIKMFLHINRDLIAKCLYGYTAAMGLFLMIA